MASSDNEAAPNDHAQGDHEAEDPQEEYQPKFNDGHFPAAMGTVVTNISQDTTATQQENAESLFQFLKDPVCGLHNLNNDDNATFTALVSTPNTTKVKVIYGLGFGTPIIGRVSPLTSNILALHDEGGPDIGPPSALLLPATMKD